MTNHLTRREIIARGTLRDFKCLRRHINNGCKRASGSALAIATVAVEHRDWSGRDFVAYRTADTSAGKRRRHFLSCGCCRPSWQPEQRQNGLLIVRGPLPAPFLYCV